jgi:hypothetical protein
VQGSLLLGQTYDHMVKSVEQSAQFHRPTFLHGPEDAARPQLIGLVRKICQRLYHSPGELAVCRGTRVEATDGYVGKVDEFMVNPENGHITHLVMREGHLWGQKDVIIPLPAMGDTRKYTVFLKFDMHQIESLMTYPVHRRLS